VTPVSITLGIVMLVMVGGWLLVGRLGSKPKLAVKDAVNRFWVAMESRGLIPLTPAFDRDYHGRYPRLRLLEEHYPVIREECDALLGSRAHLVPMQALGGSYTAGGVHTADWKTFMFKSGRFIEENCRLAPCTAALLRRVPGVYTAFFSVLEPHQHLVPHWGYYKGFLRYHLGVIVPDDNARRDCYMRVNADPEVNRLRQRERIAEGAVYYWKNGEGVVFDDTYLHDARNASDLPRVVLFLDLRKWMPWYLQWLNVICLFVAHRERSVRNIRRNARVAA
jgi:ornithine lipid ester-linked acyl 2-hydroxylase